MINQFQLKERLYYDPSTGHFTHLTSIGRGSRGTRAGYIAKNGYIQIGLFGKLLYGHRLAFLYMTGEFPEFVDHIDGNPSNNTWVNLRSCSQPENAKNIKIRKDNTSGVKGVYFKKKDKKWIVQVSIKGKHTAIGRFDDLELAELVAIEARELHYGSFARHV